MIYKILGIGDTDENSLEIMDSGKSLGLTMTDSNNGQLLFMEVPYKEWEELMKIMGYAKK